MNEYSSDVDMNDFAMFNNAKKGRTFIPESTPTKPKKREKPMRTCLLQHKDHRDHPQ